MVAACCNDIFGGREGVSMSICAGCRLLLVLGLLHLAEGAAAAEHSSCTILAMRVLRLWGVESTDCCATGGFLELVLL